MTHREIFEAFTKIFAISNNPVQKWWKKGNNTLRIRLKTGPDVIFTYLSPDEWKIETSFALTELLKNGI